MDQPRDVVRSRPVEGGARRVLDQVVVLRIEIPGETSGALAPGLAVLFATIVLRSEKVVMLFGVIDVLMPPPLPLLLPALLLTIVLLVTVATAVLPLPLLKCRIPPPSPLLVLPVIVLLVIVSVVSALPKTAAL